ncbi:MAG TPA: type II toxin-antitoxin system RelE/ParE family toxin [Ensifer sp.]|nr:type II toxin-antitoxin system RelE/ParE family toxin [Ensifer sp.]
MTARKRLIVAPLALRDLSEMRDFIAQSSPRDAEALLADLTRKIAWIAEVDFTGSPRDHILPGLRGLPYRQRCIYYRSLPDRIVILRVLHGAQDVLAMKFEG